ncbi:TetR family transcriptional regulator [Kribbella pratensis]|uniref:TetR family transcriptional regulator n=1 Tax=Kribbella pratensis TaxID=2512112 RepID=A0ABY2FQI4_9ACTN|nr:TetR/AcrR family transcriptional regulator C-terminal domain-containing protein [Kribbella pratensis]TDW95401.1 TetR family transcriptional regulator [Kribbella pratensis]
MPHEKLSLEQIVRCAVGVLDADGLGGLNLRRLGVELGVAPSALYWHVRNKDDLVVLAGDYVWNEVDLPDADRLGWRAATVGLAGGIRDMLARHFWLVTAMSTHVIYGPGKARVDDHSLGIYESAGFSAVQADQAAATVLMFVIGAAHGDAAERAWNARLRRSGADQADELRSTIDQIAAVAQEFPRLRTRQLPTAAITAEQDPFMTGLNAVLSGLEVELLNENARPPTA